MRLICKLFSFEFHVKYSHFLKCYQLNLGKKCRQFEFCINENYFSDFQTVPPVVTRSFRPAQPKFVATICFGQFLRVMVSSPAQFGASTRSTTRSKSSSDTASKKFIQIPTTALPIKDSQFLLSLFGFRFNIYVITLGQAKYS